MAKTHLDGQESGIFAESCFVKKFLYMCLAYGEANAGIHAPCNAHPSRIHPNAIRN
jgi:hypothetical protein